MAGWHHWLDGRESEWTPGDCDGQEGLACCGSWGWTDSDMTEQLNDWTEVNWRDCLIKLTMGNHKVILSQNREGYLIGSMWGKCYMKTFTYFTIIIYNKIILNI